MDSFSITVPPPPPSPSRWRYGAATPEGYRWPAGDLAPGLNLVCETCGATVDPDSAERHDEWHRSLVTHG